MKLTEEKRDASGARGFDSPFFHTTETLTGAQEKPPTTFTHLRDPHQPVSTPDKIDMRTWCRGTGSRAASQEQPWSFQPLFTPIELRHHSPSVEDEALKNTPHLPSPGTAPSSLPYEALFDLALPRAASLFMSRRSSEALDRAVVQSVVGVLDEAHGVTSASPLEVLDRLVQQGSDAHDRVLKR